MIFRTASLRLAHPSVVHAPTRGERDARSPEEHERHVAVGHRPGLRSGLSRRFVSVLAEI